MSDIWDVFWAIVRREVLDLTRDSRTIKNAFLASAMAPIMVLVSASALNNSQNVQSEAMLAIPIEGAEYAPALTSYLQKSNIRVFAPDVELQKFILSAASPIGLRINKDFGDKWLSGGEVGVELLYDASQRKSAAAITRIEKVIAQFNNEIIRSRLAGSEAMSSAFNAVAVQQTNIATPAIMQATMLAMLLPFLLSMLALVSASHVVIDSTAGERERRSLEPLLATPASARVIMSGKLFVSCGFGILGIAISQFILVVASYAGYFNLHMTVTSALSLVLVLLPLVVAGSTLLTWFSASAKSVREAQGYLAVMIAIPMLSNLATMFIQLRFTSVWAFAIPLVAQNQLIASVVREEPIPLGAWAINFVMHLMLIGFLWFGAARRYSDERFAVS